MNLVCLILVLCVPIGKPEPGKTTWSCEVAQYYCQAVDDAEEKALRSFCDGEQTCLEPSPRMFVLRRRAPEPPPPAKGGARI